MSTSGNEDGWTPEQEEQIERDYTRRGFARCPVDEEFVKEMRSGHLGEKSDRVFFWCCACSRKTKVRGGDP